MEYNKLVRDKIPEIIINKGGIPVTHIANQKEYEEALKRKLFEEANEFLDNPSIEEVADILEVMRAICDLKNINLDNLEEIRQKKAKERGGFKLRIILDRTEKDY